MYCFMLIFFFRSSTRPDTSAFRRLNFQTPNTYCPSAASSFYSRSRGTDVFVPETPQRDTYDYMHWQPEQSLPTGPLPLESESGTSIELQSMLQSMQHTIKSNLEEVKGKLVELDSRITSMEKQLQLEKNYRRRGTSSSSEESPSDRTRKRRTPFELQVSIFPIYVLS